MPRPKYVTVSSLTASAWIPLDRFSPHRSLSVALSSGASLVYSVEYTNDDVQAADFVPGSATVLPEADLTSMAESAFVQGENNMRAVRLNVTEWTSGSATLQIIQGD